MSDSNNPLFENQKEFLERQKQEYKNALLSDVTELKTQSQKVGKTLLMAGAGLAGLWMVTSMLRGKKKNKPLKGLKAKPTYLALPQPGATTLTAADVVQPDGSLNYADALAHAQQGTGTQTHYYQAPPQPSAGSSLVSTLLQSDMAKALSQQVTAFLLVYLTKKIEEHLQVSKNADIAPSKETETRDIDFSYHEEDAV